MTRKTSKTPADDTSKRMDALESKLDNILELITAGVKTSEPNVTPSSEMTEAQRETMIQEQNEKLTAFCKTYNLIAFEITGYSFKNNDSKSSNHSMTAEEKTAFSAIFDSANQIEQSGLASGKSIVTFVNVAEVQKVV